MKTPSSPKSPLLVRGRHLVPLVRWSSGAALSFRFLAVEIQILKAHASDDGGSNAIELEATPPPRFAGQLSPQSLFLLTATVGANGRPANRTVVFRGFQDETDRIQINTDSRTRKIEDLKHCPFAEICWYFTDSWEQFRINGMVDVIDGSNPDSRKLLQRENSWFASSMKSRMQYLSPNPGLPSIGEELPKDFCLDPSAGPVSAFCLLVLDPDKVDYLNVKTNTRLIFECSRTLNGDKCWTSEIINP